MSRPAVRFAAARLARPPAPLLFNSRTVTASPSSALTPPPWLRPSGIRFVSAVEIGTNPLADRILKRMKPLLTSVDLEAFQLSEIWWDDVAKVAEYTVSDAARKRDELEITADGEEIGEGKTLWHTHLGLPPTFSTWSQVTMLYLYLLTTRIRCMDEVHAKLWKKHFTNAFFARAELLLRIHHEVHSTTLMQRYLKDLFLRWRGLLMAYDEGIFGGDTVLAAALWRSLFRADPDVDLRRLEAVVAWIRHRLKALEAVPAYPRDPIGAKTVQEALRLLSNTAEIRSLAPSLRTTPSKPAGGTVP